MHAERQLVLSASGRVVAAASLVWDVVAAAASLFGCVVAAAISVWQFIVASDVADL